MAAYVSLCKWCFEMLPDLGDDKANTEMWSFSNCKIIVTNSDVNLIDKDTYGQKNFRLCFH